MKKMSLWLLTSVLATSAYADIPYCSGTSVTGAQSDALQYVVQQFADENHCDIGTNCILNFDDVKYSIAWSGNCAESASKNNDPRGSTFVCANGVCYPLGFSEPNAAYNEIR